MQGVGHVVGEGEGGQGVMCKTALEESGGNEEHGG